MVKLTEPWRCEISMAVMDSETDQCLDDFMAGCCDFDCTWDVAGSLESMVDNSSILYIPQFISGFTPSILELATIYIYSISVYPLIILQLRDCYKTPKQLSCYVKLYQNKMLVPYELSCFFYGGKRGKFHHQKLLSVGGDFPMRSCNMWLVYYIYIYCTYMLTFVYWIITWGLSWLYLYIWLSSILVVQ